MLEYRIVDKKNDNLDKIINLYFKAFPINEIIPLDILEKDISHNNDFIEFYHDDIFVGFAMLLDYKDISHIIYFAIDDKFRGHGYGSAALELIKEIKAGMRILADIEMVNDSAINNEERLKRRHFYERSGFRESGIEYFWSDEYYKVLVCGNDISESEFAEFWKHFPKEDEYHNG